MNVLVVEDDRQVALSIRKTLIGSSYINFVDLAGDYNSAYDKLYSSVYDILLLDIFLGKDSLTGLDLCKKIREMNKNIPIMMITSFHSISYLEKAFKLGANDYIKKPFNSRELVLRVERWLRVENETTFKDELDYCGLNYNVSNNKFVFRDKGLKLTKKNKFLLKLFIEKPEQLLTNEYIKEKLWGDYTNILKSRNLRSNIQELRKSLKPDCDNWIKTIRGEGYILKK